MAYRGGVRVAARQARRQGNSKMETMPAPIYGWVINENLAGQRKGGAVVLDNGFPTETSVEIRGGAQKVATVGSGAITAIMPYFGSAAANNRIFAATETAIYNISAFNPTVAPAAESTGVLTGGRWVHTQTAVSGGEYLVCVNGVDTPRLYDGTWSTAVITGATSSSFDFVWTYRNRLWFANASTTAYYLPADSIGGAVGSLELGGIFQRGGRLLFGGTWSLDAGDGVDDKLVLISDRGEVAIYEGDPSLSDFRIVGRYDITPPMGPQASMQAGGDMIVATQEGLVPISQAVQKDPAALSLSAVSRPIEPAWRRQVRASTAAEPWKILKWPERNKAIISLPHTEGPHEAYVVNLKTGAWCRYTGWNLQHMAAYEKQAYFSDGASGDVFRMETTGRDNDLNYTVQICLAFDHLGKIAQRKSVHMSRTTWDARTKFDPRLSVAADYDEDFPPAPNAAAESTATPAIWGTGVWGVSRWGDAPGSELDRKVVTTRWRSTPAAGFTFAPQVQVTVGSSRTPDVELIQIDVLYEDGAIVV